MITKTSEKLLDGFKSRIDTMEKGSINLKIDKEREKKDQKALIEPRKCGQPSKGLTYVKWSFKKERERKQGRKKCL